MDTTSLRDEVNAIQWYHVIDLGHGVRTPGLYDAAQKVPRMHFPTSLAGKSVLDIGAWDGFWSFEAERRGADRVLATDSFSWDGGGWGTKKGFELARRTLGSKVEDKTIDVLDLSPDAVGTFDVVMFLGVLYHMRHPQLAIDRVASVCSGMCILETHVDLVALRKPSVRLYGPDDLNHDWTNYCGPNPAAIELMLKGAGFQRVEVMAPASPLYNVPKWFATRALKRGHRMTFHAYK